MTEEREFKLTGGALKSVGGRRRTRTRKSHKGGDNSGALMQVAGQSEGSEYSSPGTQQLTGQLSSAAQGALASSFGPDKIASWGSPQGSPQSGGGSTGATVQMASSRSIPGTGEPVARTSGVSLSQPGPWQAGGKLQLLPRQRTSRIALERHKGLRKGGSDPTLLLPGLPPAGGARKSRKIHLRVKGVTARLNKAKKAKKMADAAPLSVIKLRLEKAGIVKKGSKAPESMLRTMYTDLLITKKGL